MRYQGGALVGTGTTGTAGPGYHQALVAALEELQGVSGASLEVEDDTAYWQHRERPLLEAAMIHELKAAAVGVKAALATTAPIVVGPWEPYVPRGTKEPILTCLGPRGEDWPDRILAATDPQNLQAEIPWWGPGKDAMHWRNLALAHCWRDVTWTPWASTLQVRIRRRAADALARARTLDPDLPLPLREWERLCHLLGDAPGEAEVAAEIGRRGAEPFVGGYRRRDLEWSILGDWIAVVPGFYEATVTPGEALFRSEGVALEIRAKGFPYGIGDPEATAAGLLEGQRSPGSQVDAYRWRGGAAVGSAVVHRMSSGELRVDAVTVAGANALLATAWVAREAHLEEAARLVRMLFPRSVRYTLAPA